MKPGRCERIAASILLIIFGGIVIHAPVTVWVSVHWPSWALLAKSWKEILMVVAALLIAVSITKYHMWHQLWQRRTVQLAMAFIALHLVTAVITWHGQSTVAGLMIDLRFVVYFVLVMALLMIAPGYKRRFIQVGVAGAAIALGFAALQWLLPRDFLTVFGYGPATIMPYLTIDQNEAFVRLQSILRGPNPLGMYAMIVLSGLIAYMTVRWQKIATRQRIWGGVGVALGLNALVFSQSRSAWLAMGAAMIILTIPYLRQIPKKAWGIVGLIVVVAGIIFASQPTLVSNVFFHTNPDESSSINSDDGHASSLMDGVRRLVVEPFGAGIGSTGSASLLSEHPLIIENYYLFVAHEVGWLGLGIFVWLFAEIIRQTWRHRQKLDALALVASGVGILVASMLLPVLADDTVSIMWWGLAAVVNYATVNSKRYISVE